LVESVHETWGAKLTELDSRTVRIRTTIMESLNKNIKELERELKSSAGESEEFPLKTKNDRTF
jgi:hypothetical protein